MTNKKCYVCYPKRKFSATVKWYVVWLAYKEKGHMELTRIDSLPTLHRLLFHYSRFILLAAVITAFNAWSAQPVYIGLDADLSAVAIDGGNAIERGAQLAIDDINAAGGILGRQVQLVVKDHRGNPARGKQNIETLASMNNLIAVIGGVHTPVALSELALIHKHKMLYLGAWAAGTSIVDNGYSPNYVFRVSVRDAEAAQVLLADAKRRGFTKIALVLERTSWGRSNLKSITQEAARQQIDIVATQWVNWRQREFDKALKNIVSKGADAILAVLNAPEGALVVNTMLDSRTILPMISHWGIAGGNFVDSVGIERLNTLDIHILQTFNFENQQDNAVAQHVFNAYRNKYDMDATTRSIKAVVGLAHAYDLVNMVALAAEQAQSLKPDHIRDALEQLEHYQGIVKFYERPFTSSQHDALWADDYIMAKFDDDGCLVPVK